MSRVNLCVLSNLPNDYEHTINFISKQSQLNYFASKELIGNIELNIQSDGARTFIIVPYSLADLNNVDYCYFDNDSLNGKTQFYFVTKRVYRGKKSTQLDLQLDVFNTYMFDYEFNKCFVVREHTGLNYIDEPISTGFYKTVSSGIATSGLFDRWHIVFGMSTNMLGEPTYNIRKIGNLVSPLYHVAISADYINVGYEINSTLALLAEKGKLEAIQYAFMFPSAFLTLGEAPPGNANWNEVVGVTSKTITVNTAPVLDGYTPVNSKCYNYPYSFTRFTTSDGNSVVYKRNLQADPTQLQFRLNCLFSPNGYVTMIPLNYDGVGVNYGQALSFGEFPVLGWLGNTYSNWIAQHRNSVTAQQVGGLVNLGVSVAEKNVIGGIMSSMAILQQTATREDMKVIPPQTGGTLALNGMSVANNTFGCIFEKVSVYKDKAKELDGYFSMYGYKVNEFKIPNINSRSNFNYIQLENINLSTMGIPKDDLQILKNIYRQGTTIWHIDNGASIGNYLVENKEV